MGIATGLKYTAIIFSIPLVLNTLLNFKQQKDTLKISIYQITGIIIGFLISDGFWLYTVYKHFLNPMYPYFNNIFHSPFGTTDIVLDTDYLHIRPKTFFSGLLLPFQNYMAKDIGCEYAFADLKIPVSFLMIIVYCFLRNKSNSFRQTLSNIANLKIIDSFIIITVSAFYINTYIFGQLRYILALIPLMCIIITVFCHYFSEIISKKIKLSPIALVPLIALSCFCFFKFSIQFYNKSIFIGTYIILFALILWLIFAKKLSAIQKNFLSIMIFFALLFAGTYQLDEGNTAWNLALGKVLLIEKMDIKDNSTVLCGSTASCSIAPDQNKNAKYIAYSLQGKYKEEKKELYKNNYISIIEYTSPYSEKLMKDIFSQKNDLYFVYFYQDWELNYEGILNLYRKSIFDYSDNKIDLLNDCTEKSYKMYSTPGNNVNDKYVICKLR